ncbi:MAG: DinB family protein [Thermoanaerobaculia bacterium]
MPNEPRSAGIDALLDELETMPAALEGHAANFPGKIARRKPPGGGFSFLENVWHLADLEREGFGERIRRLRNEDSPSLPDFNGERVARERRYNELDLERGLASFSAARKENVRSLRNLPEADWERSGAQEGAGTVCLRDVPRMMREHDRSHTCEIEELFAFIAR